MYSEFKCQQQTSAICRNAFRNLRSERTDKNEENDEDPKLPDDEMLVGLLMEDKPCVQLRGDKDKMVIKKKPRSTHKGWSKKVKLIPGVFKTLVKKIYVRTRYEEEPQP